jgi:DNA (cytosine-5)-methyltransferase 1
MCLTYASLCDGIGAVHVAWQPLGWRCAWTSEIEPFPAAVVDRHWGLPNLGDMTRITEDRVREHGTVDLVAGGTPCQSFSIAGLRKGLDDPRGNLALEFLRVVDLLGPRWVLWENVPGVLSSGRGRDFGAFITALAELGYGFCWRVLDARYFGVPQRRRRVFVVGCAGGWRPSVAVLLEPDGLPGHPAPRRQEGAEVARALTASTGGCSGKEQQHTFIGADGRPLNALCMAHGQANAEVVANGSPALTCNHEAPIVTHTLRAEGHDAGEDGQGHQAVCCPVGFSSKGSGADASAGLSPTVRAGAHDGSHANGGTPPAVACRYAVRRLTPRECERLQGFPDDYTLVPGWKAPARKDRMEMVRYFLASGYGRAKADMLAGHPDGRRYRALGNSMAVPVMAWLGRRIAAVNALLRGQAA